MMQPHILVVDDDRSMRDSVAKTLERKAYAVFQAPDATSALTILSEREFDVIISDIRMPGLTGNELLREVKKRSPETEVILLTAFATVETALEAMKDGAFDYLTKPIQPQELEQTIQRALSAQCMAPTDTLQDPFAGIIAQDPGMQKLFSMIGMVSMSSATVLLEGESGTGKRVIAQAIHRADPKRHNHPFVEISCGALPETLLESELFGHVRGSFTGAIRDKQGRS